MTQVWQCAYAKGHGLNFRERLLKTKFMLNVSSLVGAEKNQSFWRKVQHVTSV